jgi:hypothetical protein
LKKIYLAKAKATVELKETRKEILRLKQESVKEAGQAKDAVALKRIQDLEGKLAESTTTLENLEKMEKELTRMQT